MEPDALMQSRLLKLLCGCTCFELTSYWRSTGRPYADGFIQARHTDRGLAIADARARFPAKPGPADWLVCLSHRRRRLIIAASQKRAAHKYRECFPGGLVVRVGAAEH